MMRLLLPRFVAATVCSALVFLLVVADTPAARPPVVPLAVQAQIKRQSPSLAYAPTRLPPGFHYVRWLKTPQTVQIAFDNRAGWEIRFVALADSGRCRAGMEKSYQLDGNRVYWSQTGAEQQAWRCLARPGSRSVRLVASSPQPRTLFAAVGLGRVVASAARIR